MGILVKRLKQEREFQELTQKDMAERLKIPLDTYRNYESNGKRHCDPSLETISIIADVLKVTVDYLLGRS